MSNPVLSAAAWGDSPSLPAAEWRALVVEDDAPIRSLVGRVLEREGFRVDVAENGRQALELLRVRDYGVILLDLAMPEMNGVELLEHLRSGLPRALRRIVVMTASLHLLRPGLPEGICRVITKPFTIDQLRAAIADCSPAVGR